MTPPKPAGADLSAFRRPSGQLMRLARMATGTGLAVAACARS